MPPVYGASLKASRGYALGEYHGVRGAGGGDGNTIGRGIQCVVRVLGRRVKK